MNRRQMSRCCTIEAVASLDNLFLAAARARRGKSRREDVETWWLRREWHLRQLREKLLSGAWRPGPYHFFEIFEPKRRLIAAAPFADRVVHHALCLQLAPVLERSFIPRSFSCQIGKGTTAARECCRRLVNRHDFVLKCDVAKFFPNIDHAILKEQLAARAPCRGVLDLMARIIDSYRTGLEIALHAFPGDSPELDGPRGVPIGNLTSQLWGNFYLDDLDHWITETQRHGAYLRYTDDFLLFGNDKKRLWELREGIVEHLASIRLRLAEPKSRLLATREGVPFCGFRFLPDLRPRILGATKRRFEMRRYRLFTCRALARLTQAVFAWYQFSREANSQGLRRAYAAWPLDPRLKRRRRKHRVLRGGSWNNDDPDNFTAFNRNNNNPDNRNDNNGFRCGLSLGVSPKAGATQFGAMSGGTPLPGRSQEASLTAAPAPAPNAGKDAARAVAGNPDIHQGESHGPPAPRQLELDLRLPQNPRAGAAAISVHTVNRGQVTGVRSRNQESVTSNQ